jgi:hypothetical protein
MQGDPTYANKRDYPGGRPSQEEIESSLTFSQMRSQKYREDDSSELARQAPETDLKMSGSSEDEAK